MVSQEMGLHVGDNVSLPSDGTYAVRIELPPVSMRRIGAFAGRFGEIETVTFEFTYDDTFRQEVVDGIDLLDRDRWGDQGALEPMTDDNDGETEERTPRFRTPHCHPPTTTPEPSCSIRTLTRDGLEVTKYR